MNRLLDLTNVLYNILMAHVHSHRKLHVPFRDLTNHTPFAEEAHGCQELQSVDVPILCVTIHTLAGSEIPRCLGWQNVPATRRRNSLVHGLQNRFHTRVCRPKEGILVKTSPVFLHRIPKCQSQIGERHGRDGCDWNKRSLKRQSGGMLLWLRPLWLGSFGSALGACLGSGSWNRRPAGCRRCSQAKGIPDLVDHGSGGKEPPFR
mmetsp:Transcript_6857/g.15663  ORF Transcript_6857/g.15663 Transcript_6857/m.15663 type:complete len:205 (+) Transcript_6857:880-1494(+)